MHLKRLWALAALWGALGLAGCASVGSPSHPGIAAAEAARQLPPLLPVRQFVANTQSEGGFVLSPDGRRLLWQRTVGPDIGLAVREVDGPGQRGYPTGVLSRTGSAGATYAWLPDSRHIVYLKDPGGSENTQLWVQDTQTEAWVPWAVMPGAGVRSTFVARGAAGSAKFYFASNRRDKATLDLYEADAATRRVREVARSDGQVLSWIIGTQRELAGRVRQLGPQDGADLSFEWRRPDGSWQHFQTAGGFDAYWVHRLDTQAGKAWVSHNLGRDKVALFERDLASGQELLLAEHPEVDLGPAYFLPGTGSPVAYLTEADAPQVTWLNPQLGHEVRWAVNRALVHEQLPAEPTYTRVQNASDDQKWLVLRAQGPLDSAELLLDRANGRVSRLNPRQADAQHLAPETAFQFTTSDGRRLHGYLIRPRGVSGPAPLVLDIHGGPWAREHWDPATFTPRQLLANRGYAVMTLNYRGSTGYGREFLWLGAHEYFGRMQQDMAEAVQWAVDQKLADPERLAVMGGSFGGFSVLAQLIQRRQPYRCGINVVGVADWSRLMDSWPPFWRNRHMFTRFYGDASQPEARARLRENSPITHLDKIQAPLLVVHGSNDVRVLRQDSDDVVAALKARKHPVEYLLFPDEGHGIRHWRNRLTLWRQIEDTLATCLGGRRAGFDLYEMVPSRSSGTAP